MTSDVKVRFLETLAREYGDLHKLEGSQSLYELGRGSARVYIRYSKVHGGERTFFGLRERDLRSLEGHPSVLCFLWDGQPEPLLVPYSQYEEVFSGLSPSDDGQYKVQVYLHGTGTELYIARAGRFNVEGYLGWGALRQLLTASSSGPTPQLTHSQVQSFLSQIGTIKGYDVWIPLPDRQRLTLPLPAGRAYRRSLPMGFGAAEAVLEQIDVLWIQTGSSELRALFEVEHSTAVYSGLLRLNDIHLVAPTIRASFSIVANDTRRSLFVRQLNRPTFQTSGLSEMCTFLEYRDVFQWHQRLAADNTEAIGHA